MTEAYSPKTLAEAVEALARRAVPVAGATDLMVADQAAKRSHDAVLNLLGIEELQGIRLGEKELSIGAASTFTQIRASREVERHAPALARAAATIGAAQIQNRATLGGNIANASPAGDSLPVLLALNATLLVWGPRGRRSLPYGHFHTGYRTSALGADELIERVILPLPSPPVQVFRKVGTRAAQAISKVVVAFSARPREGRLHEARLAMGSVAPTPIRLPEVEALLEREALSPGLAERAATAIATSLSPITDVRSTAEYRRHAAARVVRRILLSLLEEPKT